MQGDASVYRGEPLQVHPPVVISTTGKCAQNIHVDLWKCEELIDRRFHHVCLAHSVILRRVRVLLFFQLLGYQNSTGRLTPCDAYLLRAMLTETAHALRAWSAYRRCALSP